jgi:hypothetical protein
MATPYVAIWLFPRSGAGCKFFVLVEFIGMFIAVVHVR